MELQIILSIVGSLSSAIAAICAVVTVGITIKSIKDDRHEQKRERQTRKLSELYKKTVIDSVLKTVEKKIEYINAELYGMAGHGFQESEMKDLADYVMAGVHGCLRDAEIIKLFNKKLCQETKQLTESIFDAYGQIINKSIRQKRVSKYFERDIDPNWDKLKTSLYEYYIKEEFALL